MLNAEKPGTQTRGFDQRIENAHVDRAGGTGAEQETALVEASRNVSDCRSPAKCISISPTAAIRTSMFVGSLNFFGSRSVGNA